MKQAVILAAGAGVRLQSATNGTPKCLLEIGGKPLIAHQLQALRDVGISSVCVVIGHEAPRVREAMGFECEFIHNERYAETNSVYSLWMAREWVTGPFMVMNGDVLAHRDIFHRVLAVSGSALAYDSISGHDDEHMKVNVVGGLVGAIDKRLPSERVHGENVGILQFDRESARMLFDEAGAMIDAGQVKGWAPAAVHRLAQRRPVRAVDIAGLPWVEIDFPEDLMRAHAEIWPCINNGAWGACHDRSAGENLKRVI